MGGPPSRAYLRRSPIQGWLRVAEFSEKHEQVKSVEEQKRLTFPDLQVSLERVLGPLIFSSGHCEPQFFSALDEVFQLAATLPTPRRNGSDVEPVRVPASSGSGDTTGVEVDGTVEIDGLAVGSSPGKSNSGESSDACPVLSGVRRLLSEATEVLPSMSAAFTDCRRARRLIDFVFGRLLPGYREFHVDLFFHLSDADLFQPFFVGCCFEAALSLPEADEWTDHDLENVLNGLNDYVGYRPVATLEQVQHTTYPHERFRPVPVYLRGAGVASGPAHRLIKRSLEILHQVPANLLQEAYFDPENLHELAIDVRAYDFDHPVNKRPNYHFGLWDPDRIDAQGNYTRFIIHQMMLDALLKRIDLSEQPREQAEFEVAGTLVGTILMGAGVSGSGPDSHDSTVTLSSLMPIIANYRDDYYDWLLETVHGTHRESLEKELQVKRQPFGGVRQHLNAELGARRATQVQHVQLSKIFAKMGYPAAAARQAAIVPVTSARMICQIDCLLSSAADKCVRRLLHECQQDLLQIEQTVVRGIDCGALLDPWCLLGFDGNYPLFPAVENSVADHRADDLVGIVEHTLDIYSHLLAEAAVSDDSNLFLDVRANFSRLVQWWRKYAAHEISSLQAVDAARIMNAAELVAEALRLWKAAGASAGDVRFWAQHASIFDSPKAYQLVVDALLERKDTVASQALLVHWLSQARDIGLVQGETSYHELVLAWLGLQQDRFNQAENFAQREAVWQQIRKFYDYLEVNADEYWQVPEFRVSTDSEYGRGKSSDSSADRGGMSDATDSDFDDHEDDDEFNEFDEEDLEEDEDDVVDPLFGAAYEDVVYTDSTDDGVEGPIYETDTSKQDALEAEADRIIDRLSFLNTLAILWFEASHIPLPVLSVEELSQSDIEQVRQRNEVLEAWINQAADYQTGLTHLLHHVLSMRLPKSSDVSALMEYDRLRLIKETLLDRITATNVEMHMAVIGLRSVQHGLAALIGDTPFGELPQTVAEPEWLRLFAGILTRNPEWVTSDFSGLLHALAEKPLLYVPLGRGGNADEMISTRVRQQCFQRALASLPLMGMFQATVSLLRIARSMERRNSVGFGAVTEYDEMFRNGFCSMVHALVLAAQENANGHGDRARKARKKADAVAEERLFRQLEQLTESMLSAWLNHSRTLRLSVLEKTLDNDAWDQTVRFIKRYGGQIFTQDFLNVGNIRAVLHQGVEAWLRTLQESSQELDLELLNDLDHEITLTDAARYLSLVLEAVLENFSEYRDYNSTTTQSDRGDLIYTFMDFLRLRTKYDRVAWHLKPVVWAHQVLVKNQCNGVAGRWRRQLSERVEGEAERYLSELKKLQAKYSMRMPTVADRLSERFVQPLHIDRLCALVEPAIHNPDSEAAQGAFELLEKEAEALTKQPMGVGLEVPAWLVQLEQEVDLQRLSLPGHNGIVAESLIDPLPLGREWVQQELDQLSD